MHRRSLIILCALAMSGCAGLAVGTYGKKEWARTDFTLTNVRNQFSFGKRDETYTKTEIIELWGEPDDVAAHQNCEVLVYKNGTSWAGAGGFVGIVPIPLVVPTGTYKNRFYLQKAIGVLQDSCRINQATFSSFSRVS